MLASLIPLSSLVWTKRSIASKRYPKVAGPAQNRVVLTSINALQDRVASGNPNGTDTLRQTYDLMAMEEMAAEELIEDGLSIPAVMRALADTFPDAPALSICFTMTSVASGIEVSIGRQGAVGFPEPTAIYRVVSVVAADIFGLEVGHDRVVSARALARHWDEIGDPQFRR